MLFNFGKTTSIKRDCMGVTNWKEKQETACSLICTMITSRTHRPRPHIHITPKKDKNKVFLGLELRQGTVLSPRLNVLSLSINSCLTLTCGPTFQSWKSSELKHSLSLGCFCASPWPDQTRGLSHSVICVWWIKKRVLKNVCHRKMYWVQCFVPINLLKARATITWDKSCLIG